MSDRIRVAIISAMEMEIAGLVKLWGKPWLHVDYSLGVTAPAARVFRYDDVLLVACGIGRKPAAIATRAVLDAHAPQMVISAGLAGALTSASQVGDIVRPVAVLDAATGERYSVADNSSARGVLVTADSVLSREAKREAAERYGAVAVDMEAAVVAQIAAAGGIPFLAIKAVSDRVDFEMPPLDRFIGPAGRPNLVKLLFYAAIRPGIWGALARLKRNSDLGAKRLCGELRRVIAAPNALTP